MISPTNIKIIFVMAIVAVCWGAYNMARAAYTAISWEKTEGTVVDFERNVWSCGKGVSECYELVVGYHVRGNYYTVLSTRRYNGSKPSHMSGRRLELYYSPANPREAILAGSYGPMEGGLIIFLFGAAVLAVFWFRREKAS